MSSKHKQLITSVPLTRPYQTLFRDATAELSPDQLASLEKKPAFSYPPQLFKFEPITVHLTEQYSTMLLPGVHAIIGATGSGKSELAKTIQALNRNAAHIDFEEPKRGAIVGEAALAIRLANVIDQDGAQIVVIDSVRTLGYKSGGNTGKGGLNMETFTWTTHLDIWAKELGVLVFIVFNPLNLDEEVKLLVREATAGAVESAIIIARTAGEITTRSHVGREYEQFQFKLKSKSRRDTDVRDIEDEDRHEAPISSIDNRLINLTFPRLTQE